MVPSKQNACRSCKLDHGISFNSTVRFGNRAYRRDRQNLKIIFMICNEWINACNAILNFGDMNGHSSHLPWLKYGCKIECLQPCWLNKDEDYLRIRTCCSIGSTNLSTSVINHSLDAPSPKYGSLAWKSIEAASFVLDNGLRRQVQTPHFFTLYDLGPHPPMMAAL